MSPRLTEVLVDDVPAAAQALSRRLIAEQGIAHGALMVGRADVERIVALAALHGGQIAIAEAIGLRACRVCGCTETTACHPRPCSWVADDLCSACEPYAEARS